MDRSFIDIARRASRSFGIFHQVPKLFIFHRIAIKSWVVFFGTRIPSASMCLGQQTAKPLLQIDWKLETFWMMGPKSISIQFLSFFGGVRLGFGCDTFILDEIGFRCPLFLDHFNHLNSLLRTLWWGNRYQDMNGWQACVIPRSQLLVNYV